MDGLPQDRLTGPKTGAAGIRQIVHARLRQIAAQNDAELWQVLFIAGQQNDDLSVYMDPDYYSKWSVLTTALSHGRYRRVSEQVAALLQEIRTARIYEDLGAWQNGTCARCGTRTEDQ